MATNPAKRGALRALSLTMTALLLSGAMLAPAASAIGGPVDPARLIDDAVDVACPPICPQPPPYSPLRAVENAVAPLADIVGVRSDGCWMYVANVYTYVWPCPL